MKNLLGQGKFRDSETVGLLGQKQYVYTTLEKSGRHVNTAQRQTNKEECGLYRNCI